MHDQIDNITIKITQLILGQHFGCPVEETLHTNVKFYFFWANNSNFLIKELP